MREALTWTVIFVLVLPVFPGGAHETDKRVATEDSALGLKEWLRNISAEAEGFFDGLPEAERMTLHNDLQDTRETSDSANVARLRVRMRQLSSGADIAIVLRGGERVRGELAGAAEEEFSLFVPHPAGKRHPKLRRSFRYEEVERAELPQPKGWWASEKIRELPMGKRIEVLLVDGSKLEGRLTRVTDHGFGLLIDKTDAREYSFDDVASARSAEMSTHAKVLIGAGVAAGILLGLLAYVEHAG
jgi:hypothetical protein